MHSIGKKLRQLRIAKGVQQYQVADVLNMSRPTYILVENGKKQLTVPELITAANFLGSSLQEFVYKDPTEYKDVDLGKYKQMILNCLQYGSDKSDSKITKTKLAKLLYLVDFNWFYHFRTSMSGLTYRKIQQGPVPDQYFRAVDELFGAQDINIQPSGSALMIKAIDSNAPTSLLTDNEVTLIKKISKKWQDINTKEIVDFTHNQKPWSSANKGELVPYELILQEKPDNLY